VTWLYAAANFERNSSIDWLAIIEVARLLLREVKGKDCWLSEVMTSGPFTVWDTFTLLRVASSIRIVPSTEWYEMSHTEVLHVSITARKNEFLNTPGLAKMGLSVWTDTAMGTCYRGDVRIGKIPSVGLQGLNCHGALRYLTSERVTINVRWDRRTRTVVRNLGRGCGFAHTF
jgi:hypothetical protein